MRCRVLQRSLLPRTCSCTPALDPIAFAYRQVLTEPKPQVTYFVFLCSSDAPRFVDLRTCLQQSFPCHHPWRQNTPSRVLRSSAESIGGRLTKLPMSLRLVQVKSFSRQFLDNPRESSQHRNTNAEEADPQVPKHHPADANTEAKLSYLPLEGKVRCKRPRP